MNDKKFVFCHENFTLNHMEINENVHQAVPWDKMTVWWDIKKYPLCISGYIMYGGDCNEMQWVLCIWQNKIMRMEIAYSPQYVNTYWKKCNAWKRDKFTLWMHRSYENMRWWGANCVVWCIVQVHIKILHSNEHFINHAQRSAIAQMGKLRKHEIPQALSYSLSLPLTTTQNMV